MGNNLIILCFFICSLGASAQKEANKWYFGANANINFIGSTVTTNVSSINTLEGCASLCDGNGNLLLYTDGVSVYNRNGVIMPNGFGLQGSVTTTQSAIIVPDPGNNLKYYLFTAGPQAGIIPSAPYPGISYSVVDMSLDSGLGDITAIKNQNLVSPATEKLVAIKHCNQIDYWVLVHEWNTDAFYAYLVTAGGVAAPVITHAGIVNGSPPSVSNDGAVGYLKASPNGRKIAAAIFDVYKAELFDFDNLTGQVSNAIDIDYSATLENPYGLSFSPDNSKLYVSTTFNMYQYDVLAGSAASILASKYNVVNTSNQLGAMQIAPDNKIYVANLTLATNTSDYLYRINFPNLSGSACDFEHNAVHLISSTFCQYGLPNFNDGIFDEKTQLDSVIDVCSFPAVLDQTTRQKHYLWSTGDTTPTISITAGGIYWVTIQLSNCVSITDTIRVIDHSIANNIFLKPTNIFTPNNDDVNDWFGFKDVIGSDFDLKIYNRWGELVFNTNDPSVEWDGSSTNGNCPDGTYYWILQFKRDAICNSSLITNKGFITLVR